MLNKRLSKDVCEKCARHSRALSHEAVGVRLYVFSKDEGDWFTICPRNVSDDEESWKRVIHSIDRPPGWCPYVVEHVVSQDAEC